MSDMKPPWSIASTKRKAVPKSSTPAARKRQRTDSEEGNPKYRRKSQQTLTQAQWMTTLPPDHDDGEMRLLEEDLLQSRPPKREPGRTLKKRDSTLTQMDFFALGERDERDMDDTMIEAGPEPTRPRAISQLDGAYNSPRKPRKRKATPAAADTSIKRRDAPESQEEYKPSHRKRKSEVVEDEPFASAKRTSSRIATRSEIFADPVRNFDYFSQALGTPETNNAKPKDKPFNYLLEIKDSTEDIDIMPDVQTTAQSSLLPQTPKKHITIILSSQSPESLRTGTRRTREGVHDTPTKSQRTPLAERSTNALMHATPKVAGKRRRTPKRPPPKSKVIVLKLPKRTPKLPPTRIEDSQNLWSVPSSSPEITRMPPPAQVAPILRGSEDELEIPATSQAQESLETPAGTQDSLPSLSDLFSASKGGATTSDTSLGLAPGGEGVIVRDFAAVTSQRRATHGSPHAECSKSPIRLAVESSQVMTSGGNEGFNDKNFEDMDFGSPVANDTQFNVQVHHRVSSPSLPDRASMDLPASVHHSPSCTPAPPQTNAAGVQEIDCDLPDLERVQSSQSPIPVPRLIPRTSVDPVDNNIEFDDDDTDEVPLPKPVFVHPASLCRTTSTQVPLNDTSMDSSSPRQGPTRSNTQKSVHPASMLHPSQVSTQEPTQAFLPPSSMPQPGYDEASERPIIKIKDSSSSVVPLSQVPGHVRSSQAGLDPIGGFDLDEDWPDEYDLDLDPPSLSSQPYHDTRPQQMPTKRPLGTTSTSKESQMTTPTSTADFRPSPPKQRHSDLDNDSGPLHDSQISHLSRLALPTSQQKQVISVDSPVRDSQYSDSLPSTPDRPPPPQQEHSPIPGFNNDTQSNFTQNGHVTAAYVHRQREAGLFPKWFTPQPYQVPGSRAANLAAVRRGNWRWC